MLPWRPAVGIAGSGRRQIGPTDLAAITPAPPPWADGFLRTALFSSGNYVNNVVFVHPESTWRPW